METYSITRQRLPEQRLVGSRATTLRLGRHVFHDSRSLRYPYRGFSAITSVQHQRRVPVLDQGDLGSCTGNAALGCLGTGIFYDTVRALFDDPARADEWDESEAVTIYGDATKLDAYDGTYPPLDTGSDGLSVAKVCVNRGYIAGYEHAFGVQNALYALMERPLLVGMNWYDSFFEPDRFGEVRIEKTARVVGGHEVVLDGYTASQGQFHFTNSWGEGWGQAGRFSMAGEIFERLLDEHGDVTVFTPRTLPAPVPDPEPPAPAPALPVEVLYFADEIERWADQSWAVKGCGVAQRRVRAFVDWVDGARSAQVRR